VLVKGAALAAEDVDTPWQRDMRDIDVLVPVECFEAACVALTARGARAQRPAGRRFSERLLGEREFELPLGRASYFVELHHRLDKVVAHSVDYAAIVARSRPCPSFEALRLPVAEDHLLLVALHYALSDFRHPHAASDLAALIRRGVVWDVVERRARAWRVATVLFACIEPLVEQGVRIPAAVLARLRPPARRASKLRALSRAALAERRPAQGARWLWRQGCLRDDPARYLAGVAGYAALRGLDRLRA
jgi:hypothetical protein